MKLLRVLYKNKRGTYWGWDLHINDGKGKPTCGSRYLQQNVAAWVPIAGHKATCPRCLKIVNQQKEAQ